MKLGFMDYFKDKFWINYNCICLFLPLVFLILFVDALIKHHVDVKNGIQQPPSRCTTLNQRMSGSLTLKGMQ